MVNRLGHRARACDAIGGRFRLGEIALSKWSELENSARTNAPRPDR